MEVGITGYGVEHWIRNMVGYGEVDNSVIHVWGGRLSFSVVEWYVGGWFIYGGGWECLEKMVGFMVVCWMFEMVVS